MDPDRRCIILGKEHREDTEGENIEVPKLAVWRNVLSTFMVGAVGTISSNICLESRCDSTAWNSSCAKKHVVFLSIPDLVQYSPRADVSYIVCYSVPLIMGHSCLIARIDGRKLNQKHSLVLRKRTKE